MLTPEQKADYLEKPITFCEFQNGVLVEESRPMTQAEKAWCEQMLSHDWCSCEKRELGDYTDDGGCVCGIYQHHIHCVKCRKVTEIG